MTSRLPRGRCIATDACGRGSPLALIVLVVACTLPAGCGIWGREVTTYRALGQAQDPAEVRSLRGRDPLVAGTWEASVAMAGTPEEALALAERGLEFHPHYTPLMIMRLQILAAQGRIGELIHAARQSLAVGQPGINQALLHQALVDAELQSDDPDAAHAEVLIFGALPESPRGRVAELMARVALTQAFLGDDAAADEAFDESLAVGPEGPARLLNDVALEATRRDAALDLVHRALRRHPGHPDLQLYVIVEDMERQQFADAAQGLDRLPPDLPPRLQSQAVMLRARLDLLQERPESALAAVRARLDLAASDPHALLVLMELKQRFDLPDDVEFRERLTQATRHPRGLPNEMRRRIQALLPPVETDAP